jgi:hypothetical protein
LAGVTQHALPTITRRSVLLGAAGALALAACGGKSKDEASTDSSTDAAGDVQLLATVPPQLFFAAGPMQRAPLLLTDNGSPLADPPATITTTLLSLGDGTTEPEVIGDPTELALHDEGIPRPYYALRFSVDEPGFYGVRTDYKGAQLDTNPFQISAVADVPLPQIGDAMIPVETPTPADPRGVDPVCTLDPPCPLHDITLTEALTMGKPVAFLVSTPAYCQTGICGPVLDLLVDEAKGRDVVALHAEVWKNAAELDGDLTKATPTDALDAYGMTQVGFEPALFIGDSHGMLTDRLDLIYDTSELRQGLDQVS